MYILLVGFQRAHRKSLRWRLGIFQSTNLMDQHRLPIKSALRPTWTGCDFVTPLWVPVQAIPFWEDWERRSVSLHDTLQLVKAALLQFVPNWGGVYSTLNIIFFPLQTKQQSSPPTASFLFTDSVSLNGGYKVWGTFLKDGVRCFQMQA